MSPLHIKSKSANVTMALGKVCGGLFSVHQQSGALVVGLEGDLGAGKTTFMRGFLKGLGVRVRSASPTFVLMKHYRVPLLGRTSFSFEHVYHLDAYRLSSKKDLKTLDFDSVLADPGAIVFIEWASHLRGVHKDVVITFRHGKTINERSITFSSH